MKTSSKIIAVIIALVLTLSVGGVAANWVFAYDGASYSTTSSTIEFGVMDYISNVSSLIEAIIEEMNQGSSSEINTNLNERFQGGLTIGSWTFGDYYYYCSMDPQHDNDGIASLLASYENDYSFIVEAAINTADGETTSTYTTAYIYTCDIYLGESGTSTVYTLYANNTTPGSPTIPIGENIYRIYRTELHRDDSSSDWEEVETLLGYAESTWYKENREYSSQASMIPSYDIDTWTQGTRGYSADTAVFVYGSSGKDYSFTAYNDLYDVNADLEKADYNNGYTDYYFELEVDGTQYSSGVTNYSNAIAWAFGIGTEQNYTYNYTPEGVYSLTCGLDTAEITVFTTDGNTETTVANGTGSVTFSASTAGTKYYIRVSSGGATTALTVSRTGDL